MMTANRNPAPGALRGRVARGGLGRTNPLETNPAQPRLRALDALGDALLVVSAQGHVVDWSGAARGLLGYEAREVIGRAVDLVLPRQDLARLFPPASDQQRLETSTSAHHRDGRDLPVLVTSTPLDNADGRRVGWVCLLKDLGPWFRARDGAAPEPSPEAALPAAFHEITTSLG